MKTLLFILCLCTAAYSVPKCFDEYITAADKIEKYYTKSHIKSYEFYPTNLFPFYCLSKGLQDTAETYAPVYLCGHAVSLYMGADKFKWQVIIMTTVQYLPSKDKIYTAFFFKRIPLTKEWLDDKKPVSVRFRWDAAKQQYIY